MGQVNDFEQYLKIKGKSESTVNSYVGAFKLINQIAKENNIPEIENWETSNVEEFSNQIKKDKSYIDRNTSGNNMYSASLNHYIKFMEELNPVKKSLIDQFRTWIANYDGYKENAKKACIKGIDSVDLICIENDLGSIYTWTNENWDLNKKQLMELQNMIANSKRVNPPGSGWYSASVSKYKEFLDQITSEIRQYTIPPIKPFENFKWRWAVTTPSEGINSPEILIGVLRILYKHNGQKHATQEFQDDLLELQTDLETRIDLAKVDRGLNKNIIENSGQYWKALGLLENSTGGLINLTRLGISIAKDNANYDEFIRHLYSNFRLPNVHIESNEIIQEWLDNNIEISPIKLIFNILFEIKRQSKSPSNWYISPEELKDIIIPLSVYSKLPITQYITEIFGYRSNTQPYEFWPNCTPGDNDFRMVKEYLLFLSNFGFLDLIELKDKSKRYYLNAKSIKVLEKDYEPIVDEIDVQIDSIKQISFDIKTFHTDCKDAGLVYTDKLITRFVSSLATKPFVLLTGLSGSGKTKLAEAFAMWVCESEEQYTLIPVGADWTNREPLLGYPNALKDNEYVRPDNDALDLLMRAKEDENRPYFLVLDEMNLSHVERYFADFLSTMESKNSIPLHKMEEEVNNIPKKIKLPKNLFIVGTVNIDETTYMFSPKVLDRANTIEFRVSDTDISGFLKNPKNVELEKLNGKGAGMAKNFVEIATATKNGKKIAENYQLSDSEDQDVINNFFIELQKAGTEFGYRTAFEISKLIYKLDEFDLTEKNEKLDIAIMQKMLPKLHGSRTKLTRTLKPLAKLCLKDVSDNFDKEYFEDFENINFKKDENIRYKLSFEKIMRMYKNAVENGFASYAEA